MNQVLLDTNILSYFLRGDSAIVAKFRAYRQFYPYLSFSIFTYYEIKSGLLYRDAQRQLSRFEQLAEISEILDYDRSIADLASHLYQGLRAKGLLITPINLFIGATALHHEYTLITANIKHFQNIPNLKLENWKEPVP